MQSHEEVSTNGTPRISEIEVGELTNTRCIDIQAQEDLHTSEVQSETD